MKPPVFSCLSSRVLNNGSLYGRFLFGPLPIDISLTIATILRRSLLHTQANLYIISAEIEGATHEYASLPGIQESVLEILLNLGEIVLARKNQNLAFWAKNFSSRISVFDSKGGYDLGSEAPLGRAEGEGTRSKAYGHPSTLTALLQISGPCVVKAKDITWPEGVWCVKPDMPIATLSNNQTLAMRLKIMPLLEQKSSKMSFVAENSESFSIRPYRSSPFRTESSSGELSPKDKTWPSFATEAKPLRKDRTLFLETKSSEGLVSPSSLPPSAQGKTGEGKKAKDSVPPRPSALTRGHNLPAFGTKGALFPLEPIQERSNEQDHQSPHQNQKDQKINNKFWSSRDFKSPTKASDFSIKSESRNSPPSIKKAEGFITRKASTSGMLLEDLEQQRRTIRRPLPQWNKEGFLLGSKEIENLTNIKEYHLSTQTSLPRKYTFSQKKRTKKYTIPLSGSYESSLGEKEGLNQISEKEPRLKFSKHIEGNNQIKTTELVVSPTSYPVEKVNFLIERDDQLAGYRHRIIFEVWTNGSISPRQAIFDSIGWILKLLYNFRQPAI